MSATSARRQSRMNSAAAKKMIRSSAERRVGDPGEHQRLDLLDVARHSGDEVAEAVAVEDVERQALDVVEHPQAQSRAGSARRSRCRGSRRRTRPAPRSGSERGRRAAIQASGSSSPGTRTSSTTSLNSQISAVSTRAPTAISASSTGSQRRYGRACGQKRFTTVRSESWGACGTASSNPVPGETRRARRARSRFTGKVPRDVRRPRRRRRGRLHSAPGSFALGARPAPRAAAAPATSASPAAAATGAGTVATLRGRALCWIDGCERHGLPPLS